MADISKIQVPIGGVMTEFNIKGSGGGGGHTIIDESGTSLTQEPNLQFKGADVSDDSTNNRTVVDMSYTEIDYEDWLELTEQEKETGRWDVVGVPGADGTISVELMTKLWENPSPTSAFTAQDITLSSDDYDMLLWIFYSAANVALCCSNISLKSKNTVLESTLSTTTNVYNRFRICNYTDTTHYNILAGTHIEGTGPRTEDNNACIPVHIYGIKTRKTIEIKAIAPEVSTSASKCMMSDGETSVEEAITEIDERISTNTIVRANNIQLTYNTAYTTLADGYFRIACDPGIHYITGYINDYPTFQAIGDNSQNYTNVQTLFVRKGSIIKFSGDASSSGTGYFCPLS